jgi:hypothetical protein
LLKKKKISLYIIINIVFPKYYSISFKRKIIQINGRGTYCSSYRNKTNNHDNLARPTQPQVKHACGSLINPFLRLSTYKYSLYTCIISTARNTSIEYSTYLYTYLNPRSAAHSPHPTPIGAESATIGCSNCFYSYSSNCSSSCSCF